MYNLGKLTEGHVMLIKIEIEAKKNINIVQSKSEYFISAPQKKFIQMKLTTQKYSKSKFFVSFFLFIF